MPAASSRSRPMSPNVGVPAGPRKSRVRPTRNVVDIGKWLRCGWLPAAVPASRVLRRQNPLDRHWFGSPDSPRTPVHDEPGRPTAERGEGGVAEDAGPRLPQRYFPDADHTVIVDGGQPPAVLGELGRPARQPA